MVTLLHPVLDQLSGGIRFAEQSGSAPVEEAQTKDAVRFAGLEQGTLGIVVLHFFVVPQSRSGASLIHS